MHIVFSRLPLQLRESIFNKIQYSLLAPSQLIQLFQSFALTKVKWSDLPMTVQESIVKSVVSFAVHWTPNANGATYYTLLQSMCRFVGDNLPQEAKQALSHSIRKELAHAPLSETLAIMGIAVKLGVLPDHIGNVSFYEHLERSAPSNLNVGMTRGDVLATTTSTSPCSIGVSSECSRYAIKSLYQRFKARISLLLSAVSKYTYYYSRS